MKAMVLAAGLGTRLRPLTDDRPKALVELCGKTLLEITLDRLRFFGIRDVIVNAHHFADKLVAYLESKHNFGMNITVSREDVLLDTGGGLKKAGWFFLQDKTDEPFLLHNADVLSDIDLAKMVQVHKTSGALSTLAVRHRKTSRYLLFDQQGQLCGRRMVKQGKEDIVRPSAALDEVGFCGIHVISPRLLPLIHEEGVFSIIDVYLRLAAQGESIRSFDTDPYQWRDLGRLEDLKKAEEDLGKR